MQDKFLTVVFPPTSLSFSTHAHLMQAYKENLDAMGRGEVGERLQMPPISLKGL